MIEKKWQQFWEENKTFKAVRRPNAPKKYVLDMFPYPSGSGLHVGHPEGYTASDIMARYWRMKGFDVLHPMGWDAFGLPAEQHAINTGTHPADTTLLNIQSFKRQLKSLGFSYDWDRELSTTDEDYVKWTQWIFLQLFKSGLAHQSQVNVNWCPALGTVLANEEVINGLSERGNHPVVRQPLRQWVLKITDYADKLESGLKDLQWPEGTVQSQRQWIGKSEGASISFKIEDADEKINVFTTRPDTLMGVSYLVLAPEHPLVSKIVIPDRRSEVEQYVSSVAQKSDLDRTSQSVRAKSGLFLGSFATHPLTGERIPVWTADYVLCGYGSGAVMAVPAHDERDWEFAQKYNLPIKKVVECQDDVLPFTGQGVLCNSGQFNGLDSHSSSKLIVNALSEIGAGSFHTTYKLRDWVFSRQRYWGEPIPVYFPVKILTADGSGSPVEGCPHEICFEQPIPVDECDLPLRLPPMDNFHPGNDPQGCLARALDWRYFNKDGQWFARETNTMPQWAGSCWYYLRFVDPKNSTSLFGSEARQWLPVDLYIGGSEHAVLHLLYARFWHKVLFDLKVVDHSEPFIRLVHQGMILGEDGEKMSKSRGNVVNPDNVVQEHGADVLRMYEMFMGPLEAVKPWQTDQIIGMTRFRDRVYSLLHGPLTSDPPDNDTLKSLHKTINKVTTDIENLSFNTAISSLMVLTNTLLALPTRPTSTIKDLLLLLSPFAPHLCEEGWSILSSNPNSSISSHPWPVSDPSLCQDSTCKIVVQVNNKVRATLTLPLDANETQVTELAQNHQTVLKFLQGKSIVKIVFVPGKLMNFLVK